MSEQLELPLAPIQRIVKAALPQGATVAKEVKQSLGKAAALFILYLTNTSVDTAHCALDSFETHHACAVTAIRHLLILHLLCLSHCFVLSVLMTLPRLSVIRR